MVKKFTTWDEFERQLTLACNHAVQNTAKIMEEKLHEFTQSQYYNDPQFYPNVYERTETFLRACASQMLSANKASIGVDIDSMKYSNGFSGQQVVKWATQSMHGSPLYKTETKDFWSSFLEWADENAVLILKEELRKQGIPIK